MSFGATAPPTKIFTVHTHVIDDTFEIGDSLIGGAQTIDGMVLSAYVVDQDPVGDWHLEIELFLNGINVSATAAVLEDDGDHIGYGEQISEGTRNSGGWSYDFFRGGGELPHTSYNLKAKRAGVYKKTVKVVVLNRS